MVCELDGPGPTLYISSTTVITGPFDCFTTFKFGDMEVESSGGNGDFAAASLAACAARASRVQVVPVITAAAPITALRMMKVRRSMFEPCDSDSGNCGNRSMSLLSDFFMERALSVWV